ncbi:hypothetical protein FPY71_05945 [Aureimonas fodinaquatilis]|uniref:Hpt domain-containing protein n=1 Tax=Aureimonas fodinaquatilis TaxID=2565783 RepID=A0A5B0E0L3_9HYPH|nr:hypothetical protein [Aureimonas fodinaquatilis]KAA0972614.1 hypothetical protein FPY71_05945 [Aureimonas fodinaquatilis]
MTLSAAISAPFQPVDTVPTAMRGPIDFAFLAGKSGGDRQVERNVLALLRSQIGLVLQRAPHASEQELRLMATAMRGAGRHVGAFAIADAASDVEKAAPAVLRLKMQAFTDALNEAATFLRTLD